MCQYVSNWANYKIKTPDGYQNFKGIRKLSNKQTIKIIFENNISIIVTPDHKFKENIASKLKINDYLFNEKHGNLRIINIIDNRIPRCLWYYRCKWRSFILYGWFYKS